MNGSKTKGDNRHYHTHYLPVVNVETKDILDKDAELVRDHSTERASFQGRFRKTAFGDFKNRSGHKSEHTEAMAANDFVDEAKKVLVDAATESGVIIETDPVAMQDINLHRLNDDGGPIHE
jgi:hypothetical protein